MASRDSVLYDKLWVKKYLGDARDHQGAVIPIYFEHTVVSGETGGASAGVQDTVNLGVIPAGCRVVGLNIVMNAVWASAGVNGTIEIGDSGDTDRYLKATEAYDAESPRATEGDLGGGRLANAGFGYKPTADTVFYLTWKVANPVVGKVIKGCLFVTPAMG